MSVPYPCHLLVDPPAGGSWNMAVDEALLERVGKGDSAVWLRFYQWHEPTLSLGYFQPFAPWRDHVRGECAVVRRQTGGGAILHDDELTYSIVLPPRHPLSRTPDELYVRIHQALIASLSRFDVSAELWARREPTGGDEPYLCFQRRAASDVVVRAGAGESIAAESGCGRVYPSHQLSSYKVCGSAQRRRHGALLLHGSLLLRASALAPQLLGIQEVTGKRLTPEEVRAAWLSELIQVLGQTPGLVGGLPAAARRAAEGIERDRYRAAAWLTRR